MTKNNTGLMFGSFDPPHLGHVGTAEKAKKEFKLDNIFMLPVAQSPIKLKRKTPFETKMEMCEIITQPNKDWLIPSEAAKNLSMNPLYCFRDLKRLVNHFSKSSNLYIVSGEDWRKKLNLMVRALHVSHNLTNTLSNKTSLKIINEIDKRVGKACNTFNQVSIPALSRTGDISSSLIRQLIQENDTKIIEGLSPNIIPVALMSYILDHSVYTQAKPK